jgi:hypothetical protein
MLHISHITIPFDKLNQTLNLPPTAFVVGVSEYQDGAHLVLRIVADVMPNNCSFDTSEPISNIGNAFRPEIGTPQKGDLKMTTELSEDEGPETTVVS